MPYEFACAENIGDRKEQQDRVMVMTHPAYAGVTLALIADGMGGHTGGALAAQSVADAITALFAGFQPGTGAAQDWLRGMVNAAQDRVAGAGQGFNRDPRSTCVVALAQPGRIDWVHCGDSRLYLFRDNKFVSRTELVLRRGAGRPMRSAVGEGEVIAGSSEREESPSSKGQNAS